MVFYFYENAMKDIDKISVDGLVPKSAHLSHWRGNQTPVPFKADTATDIVFRYLCHPKRNDLFPQFRIITNNHFDTDGLLSIWALLNPKKAEPLAGRMISSAEAGDFFAFSSEEGVQINLLVQALCHHNESPFAEKINTYDGPREAAYYKYILPIVPDLFKNKDRYRPLWSADFDNILDSMTLFEKGVIGIEEYEDQRLSVIIDEKRPARQAIDRYCEGDLFLVIEDREHADGGYSYELEYRYYAWAETVTRPRIMKIPMKNLAETLNDAECEPTGFWLAEDFPGRAMTSALKYTDKEGNARLSRLHPETVIEAVLSHLKRHDEEGDLS